MTFKPIALGVTILLLLAGSAQAELTFERTIGGNGAGAGKFSRPVGLAVNNATEHLYVADRNQNRIQEFDAAGAWVRAWGYGVVKSGPDNVPAPEVQAVAIKATSGTFGLTFNSETTEPIAWNAPASTVETALNALPAINGGGGSVSVTGGPGNATGSTPYNVAFGGGPLNDTNVSTMSVVQTDLGVPVGTQLSCNIQPFFAPTQKMEWLRNGVPIAGAETSPYTTVAADEGKLIQCKATMTAEDGSTSVRASTLALPVSPITSPLPLPGSPTISGTAKVGEELTCAAGSWSGAPAFAYQWLRNGAPIAGAEAEKYAVTAADLQTAVQCEVVGTNANGVAVAMSAPTLVRSVPPSNSGEAATAPVVTGTPEVGQELTCAEGTWAGATGFSYQWLRNGAPIAGAEANTYTLIGADEGTAVQCRVTAGNADGSAVAVSGNTVIVPAPSPEPPARPSSAISVFGERNVGQTLTCNKGSWTPATPLPTFTYRWLRNGAEIGGAASETYKLVAADLDRLVQCQVTATTASGASTVVSAASGVVAKSPLTAEANANYAFNSSSSVETSVLPGESFEVCQAGDVCQAGRAGGRTGQLNGPRGVAVDNSADGSGDVYVVDDRNFRVQKYSATGTPILTIGKAVNETTGGNLCTVASGNVCKAGIANLEVPSPGGAFSAWPEGFGNFSEFGEEVAVDSLGNVYVGDVRNIGGFGSELPVPPARIEKFSPGGEFLGQVLIPGANPTAENFNRPWSVGVDSTGRIFSAEYGERAIEIFQQAQLGLEETGPTFAERDAFALKERSWHLDIGPLDDKIWVTDENSGRRHICNEPGAARWAIVAYDAGGHRAECTAPSGEGELDEADGLAISPAGLAYVSTSGNVVKVYGIPDPHEPSIVDLSTGKVTTETAELRATVNPGFEATSITFEFGDSECSLGGCATVPANDEINGLKDTPVSAAVSGLLPGHRYHYLARAENRLGEVVSSDQTFRTYPFIDLQKDPCDNALARKQTKTSGLADCRAYELASAEFTGGYDVESDLVDGQTPYSGFPLADGRLLYAVHDGGIPDTGSPTNRGPDPYVAVRGSDGSWKTSYVGLPANATPSNAPFASGLLGADSNLETFAFGGDDFCSPCFPNGEIGVPVRMPDGSLAQGMAGEVAPGAGATRNGLIAKPLSQDGSHLIFGSLLQVQADGNDDTGDISIYDRNLETGVTQVVSKTPGGANLPCLQGAGECHGPENPDGIAELDISADGSRILIGQRVGTDTGGNDHYHLYMHVGTATNTIDLTPGTTSGVGFAGMTSDGTKVFFTTRDALADDGDTSVDLYRSDVGGTSAALTRVSVGSDGSGDTDGCDPASNSYNTDDWNTIPGGPTDCSVVAIGGAGGVSTADGAVYFLSPEKLDGDGVEGAPNLFVAQPGDEPHLVTTLESGASSPVPAPAHLFQGSFGSFSNAEGTAIDPVTGATYVLDTDASAGGPGGYVKKFNAAGELDAKWGSGGELDGSTTPSGSFAMYGALEEFGTTAGAPVSIAVNSDPTSPHYRDLYVPDVFNTAIWVFDPAGQFDSKITLPGEYPSAVAVNPANGDIVVAGLFGTGFVFSSAGALITEFSLPPPPLGLQTYGIAVDSAGKIYLTDGLGAYQYSPSGVQEGTLDPNPSIGVTVDPIDDHVYVDEGDKVVEFDSAGIQVGGPIGVGKLVRSVSPAAYAGHLAITNKTTVETYGPINTPPSPSYDSPLVIDSVRSANTRFADEFQTNPSGDDAVFSTTLPLTGFDSREHLEIYRYNVSGDELDCASCLPSEAVPTSDAELPSHGLGLTDDGRVFFNTDEQLVLRDTNGKQDAYEWSSGDPTLISSGNSAFDSGLLTVTADGRDAFFFTRDQLTSNDRNGQAMKLYDAREHGGVFVIPSVQPCAASDECHGPGTKAAPPPPIGTFKGSGGQGQPTLYCKKGFVKKHGKCVKKKKNKKKKKRKRAHRRRSA